MSNGIPSDKSHIVPKKIDKQTQKQELTANKNVHNNANPEKLNSDLKSMEQLGRSQVVSFGNHSASPWDDEMIMPTEGPTMATEPTMPTEPDLPEDDPYPYIFLPKSYTPKTNLIPQSTPRDSADAKVAFDVLKEFRKREQETSYHSNLYFLYDKSVDPFKLATKLGCTVQELSKMSEEELIKILAGANKANIGQYGHGLVLKHKGSYVSDCQYDGFKSIFSLLSSSYGIHPKSFEKNGFDIEALNRIPENKLHEIMDRHPSLKLVYMAKAVEGEGVDPLLIMQMPSRLLNPSHGAY